MGARQRVGYAMILGAGILWGSIGLFVKLLSGVGASATLVAFMRQFMGCAILLVVLAARSVRTRTNLFRLDGPGLVQCMVLGVCTQALFNTCYNLCIDNVGVAAASILLYTAPVFVCVFSRLLFHEDITVRKGVSLAMNLAGCFLMVTGGSLDSLRLSLVGIAFGLASAFLYSMVTIVGRIASGNLDPFTVVFYGFFFGSITLAAFTRPWAEIALVSSPRFWLYGLGYGLIPTVGSYLLYMGGLSRDLELSRVPILASVEPVIATITGALLFHEAIGPVNVVGLAILLASVVTMNLDLRTAPSGDSQAAVRCDDQA